MAQGTVTAPSAQGQTEQASGAQGNGQGTQTLQPVLPPISDEARNDTQAVINKYGVQIVGRILREQGDKVRAEMEAKQRELDALKEQMKSLGFQTYSGNKPGRKPKVQAPS